MVEFRWRQLFASGLVAVMLLALCYALAQRHVSAAESTQVRVTSTITVTTALTPTLAPAATDGLQLAISKKLLGSDLVQVGEYLTFTIEVANTGSVTVTKLPVVDEYDPAVLQPAFDRMSPTPELSGTGVLTWTDLTAEGLFGPLPPGRSVTLVTVFRAIKIGDDVINRARVVSAIGSGGETGAPVEGQDGGEVRGGRVIIEKKLVESFVRLDTPVISFTITVSNAGAADIVRVPVEDTFAPAYMRFWRASVPPTTLDQAAGIVRWDDVLAGIGLQRLRPQEVISITTVFTVIAPIDNQVVNRVVGVNVRDEFNNAVDAPRQADVRIRIIGGALGTPTSVPTRIPIPTVVPTESPVPESHRRTPTPAPTTAMATPVAEMGTPAPTIIPTAENAPVVAQPGAPGVENANAATPAPGQAGQPVALPNTGAADPAPWWLVFGVGLLLAGAFLARYARD